MVDWIWLTAHIGSKRMNSAAEPNAVGLFWVWSLSVELWHITNRRNDTEYSNGMELDTKRKFT